MKTNSNTTITRETGATGIFAHHLIRPGPNEANSKASYRLSLTRNRWREGFLIAFALVVSLTARADLVGIEVLSRQYTVSASWYDPDVPEFGSESYASINQPISAGGGTYQAGGGIGVEEFGMAFETWSGPVEGGASVYGSARWHFRSTHSRLLVDLLGGFWRNYSEHDFYVSLRDSMLDTVLFSLDGLDFEVGYPGASPALSHHFEFHANPGHTYELAMSGSSVAFMSGGAYADVTAKLSSVPETTPTGWLLTLVVGCLILHGPERKRGLPI